MSKPIAGNYDEAFFKQQISFLYLNDGVEIIDMMYARTRPHQDPNLAQCARDYYGKEVVDGLEWKKRFAVYKCMAWLWNNKSRTLHHEVMRDRNLLTNIWNWKIDEFGNEVEAYDDHADWFLLSGEERNILIKQSYHYYKRATAKTVKELSLEKK